MKKEQNRAVVQDFFIMLSLVAVASVGVFFIRRLFGYGEEESGRLVYTLKISELDEAFASNISVGDILISADTKEEMGKVVAVAVENAFRESYSESLDAMISSPVPSKKEVTLTVEAGYKSDTGLTVGGIKLLSGGKIHTRTKDLYFIGEVGRIVL
ncbi:MAG: hypothetical protein IJX97_03835 [Clostridia bacterium]|nr:hypothetical protein [Clostridia bacterium]MBQ8720128.1 hypothetical protein [Clostridia bacterium]